MLEGGEILYFEMIVQTIPSVMTTSPIRRFVFVPDIIARPLQRCEIIGPISRYKKDCGLALRGVNVNTANCELTEPIELEWIYNGRIGFDRDRKAIIGRLQTAGIVPAVANGAI